jgi:hypothetical protein
MLPRFFVFPHGNMNKIRTFARYFIQVVGANYIGRGNPTSRLEINCANYCEDSKQMTNMSRNMMSWSTCNK